MNSNHFRCTAAAFGFMLARIMDEVEDGDTAAICPILTKRRPIKSTKSATKPLTQHAALAEFGEPALPTLPPAGFNVDTAESDEEEEVDVTFGSRVSISTHSS